MRFHRKDMIHCQKDILTKSCLALTTQHLLCVLCDWQIFDHDIKKMSVRLIAGSFTYLCVAVKPGSAVLKVIWVPAQVTTSLSLYSSKKLGITDLALVCRNGSKLLVHLLPTPIQGERIQTFQLQNKIVYSTLITIHSFSGSGVIMSWPGYEIQDTILNPPSAVSSHLHLMRTVMYAL